MTINERPPQSAGQDRAKQELELQEALARRLRASALFSPRPPEWDDELAEEDDD